MEECGKHMEAITYMLNITQSLQLVVAAKASKESSYSLVLYGPLPESVLLLSIIKISSVFLEQGSVKAGIKTSMIILFWPTRTQMSLKLA